uniref:Uncharacterized protein n=1 Tax=Pelusios castaneus TaxID=367368 RepID=A0A8C8VKF9_9SAUR
MGLPGPGCSGEGNPCCPSRGSSSEGFPHRPSQDSSRTSAVPDRIAGESLASGAAARATGVSFTVAAPAAEPHASPFSPGSLVPRQAGSRGSPQGQRSHVRLPCARGSHSSLLAREPGLLFSLGAMVSLVPESCSSPSLCPLCFCAPQSGLKGIAIMLLLSTILEFCITVSTSHFACQAIRYTPNAVSLSLPKWDFHSPKPLCH